MRNLKHNINGILIGPPTQLVERKLKNDGDTLLITAWNGNELYIKENGEIRESTDEEWVTYWNKKGKK